jgi:hypothetical protein
MYFFTGRKAALAMKPESARTFVARTVGAAAALVLAVLQPAPAHAASATDSLTAPTSDQLVVPDTTNPHFACPTYARKTMYNKDGRAEMFWVGRADGTYASPGRVWHNYQTLTGGWSGPLSLGGEVYDGLDVASNADGRLEIFVKARGHDLNHMWQVAPNSGWSSWYSLGGAILAGCGPKTTMLSFSRIAVDVTGTDQLVHRIYQQSENGNWSGWVWP